MKPSSVILLNGASSSGKTTIGGELQRILERPYFYLSSDQFVEANILPRVDRESSEGIWAWKNVRPGFFDAFHNCNAGFARAGNDVIVEHVIEFRCWYENLAELLSPFDVFYVGIHCDLIELERREKRRGNRTIGEG